MDPLPLFMTSKRYLPYLPVQKMCKKSTKQRWSKVWNLIALSPKHRIAMSIRFSYCHFYFKQISRTLKRPCCWFLKQKFLPGRHLDTIKNVSRFNINPLSIGLWWTGGRGGMVGVVGGGIENGGEGVGIVCWKGLRILTAGKIKF